MCNAAKHPGGCECGFGPPYPGKIELVETVEWVEEAASNEESFKSALKILNFSTPTFNRFVREYESIQHLKDPEETIIDRLKSLVHQLDYREEGSKHVPVQVPLFKLHSPAVKKARVTYRESDVAIKERGWLVKFFGLGMGSTKTFKVVYEPDFTSEKGECLQIYVPLILHIRSIGVYKSGVLQSRGIRAEIEGIEKEITLRKRGSQSLSPDKCAGKTLQGKLDKKDYTLASQSGTELEKFKLNLALNVARNVELRFDDVFGKSFDALARVRHERQLDLEFHLPGSRDYHLVYNTSGLQWDFT